MNKPSVVSLFAGAGGMDLGFQKAGFEIIWANDFDKDSVDTYKKNFGNHIVLGDIKDIPSSDIPNNPDVVIGGFPCQGFSINNKKRSMDDERNHLYKEMDIGSKSLSMARTTGYTATATINMLLKNLWNKKGVYPPETVGENANCIEFLLSYLSYRNVKITQT